MRASSLGSTKRVNIYQPMIFTHIHFLNPQETEKFISFMFRVSSLVLLFFLSALLYFYQMCVPPATIDLSTQANIDQVKTTHLHLNWIVDFENQNLHGNVVLDLVTLVDNVDKVVLDTSYLEIKSVSFGKESLKVSLCIYTYLIQRN